MAIALTVSFPLPVSIAVYPTLPAPLPHHDLTSRNRLNLAPPTSSASDSGLVSPPTTSPPSSPYPHSLRSPSPAHGTNGSSHQRPISIDLSNINQVHTFFFTHLLAWRDLNPTRSLGPDLVSTIIKDHYQDLTLVPNNLDAFLTVKHGKHAGAGGQVIKTDSGPHPAWDGYTEVPAKVPFFRQLTRWAVMDVRTVSRTNASTGV